MWLDAGKSNSHWLPIEIELDCSSPPIEMNPDNGTLAPLATCVDAGLTSAVIEVTLIGKPNGKIQRFALISFKPSLS